MSKHNWKNKQSNEPAERAEIPVEAEPEVHSTMQEPESSEPEVQQQLEGEPERLETLPKVTQSMGIGQFVRHLLLKSTKTNAEILELVAKHFPESKTTAACIAWYKSDLRKKGLLEGGKSRGSVKTVELSEAELAELVK